MTFTTTFNHFNDFDLPPQTPPPLTKSTPHPQRSNPGPATGYGNLFRVVRDMFDL